MDDGRNLVPRFLSFLPMIIESVPERLFPEGWRARDFCGEEDAKGSGNRGENRV